MVVVSAWMMRAPTTLPRRVKRPPESEVPPRTTERMASSSRSRPALYPSELFTLELTIRPAIPAQRQQTEYTQNVKERARGTRQVDRTGVIQTAAQKKRRTQSGASKPR